MTRYVGIIGVLAIAGLVSYGVVYWLSKPETLPIAKIELLTKLDQQNAGDLQNVASQAINGGFFSLNLELFRKKIESLAWVESVSIRKKWPDTIQLSIFERVAVARWSTIAKQEKSTPELNRWREKQLISNKGVIFSPPLSEQQLTRFMAYDLYIGPNGLAENVLKNCQKITEKLTRASLDLKTCGLDRRRSWKVELKDGFMLRLGRELVKGKTSQRIDDFVEVYQSTLKKYILHIAHVDMRYTNGFTVGWKESTKSEVKQNQ